MAPQTFASSAAHTQFRSAPAPAAPTATATQTITSTPVLRLRATSPTEQRPQRPRIQWAEDVVDNEGLGRKSSKVCCIYHRPRAVGESSDESSSSSSSDSSSGEDSSDDDGAARMAGRRNAKGKRAPRKDRQHDHAEDERPENHGDHGHSHRMNGDSKGKGRNAYEKMPKPKGGNAKTTESKG